MQDDLRTSSGTGATQTTSREFLAILFRRRWIILGLFLVTLATVVGVSFTTPVSFISSGKVLFVRGEQTSVLQPDRRIFNEWEQELGSEVQMVQSAPVIQRAAALLQAEARPSRAVPTIDPGSIDVEVISKSNVLAIGYHHADSATARVVCDVVIRAYIDYRENQMGLAYPQGFFDTELAQVERDLQRLSEERRRYFTDQGIADVQEQTRALINRLTSLQQLRAEVAANLAEAVSSMHAMRELQLRSDVDIPVPGSTGGMDALQSLKQKALDQEARVAQLRERFRDESPEVQNAVETLNTLRSMLQREVTTRLKVSDLRADGLRSRLAAIQDEETRLNAQLDHMPANEARVATLDRDIQVLKDRRKDLFEKADLARVNENVVSRSRVLLMAPAGDARPTNARDYVRLALAPAFALVVGIGLAFFIDGLDITVRTAHHAEEAVQLPVLATLQERRRRRVAAA